MTTLIKRHRMTFSVNVPEGIDEDIMKSIVAAAVAEMGASSMVTTKKKPAPKKRAVLATRTTKKKGVYPCRREPDPLFAAAIVWPTGAPHKGCGRTYGSERMRDAHEAGFADSSRTKQWNPVMFPHGCLDRILPMEMRDDR